MGDIYHKGDTYAGSVPIDDTRATATNTWSGQKINNEINELSDTYNTILNDVGAKNLLPNTATTQTVSGVAFTVNSDGSVHVNGTNNTSSPITFYISGVNSISLITNVVAEKTDLALSISKEPDENVIGVVWGCRDSTSDVISSTFNSGGDLIIQSLGQTLHIGGFALRVLAGKTVNKTYYPMIRSASIADDTYVPYAMTNRGLTKQITGLKLKYTNKTYEVTTTANSYVSPYSAIAQYMIPQADLEAYGYPISGAVTTAGYPTCPALVSADRVQICTYSAGTYNVAVRFLKLTYE